MKSPEKMQPDDVSSTSNSGIEPSIQVSEASTSSAQQAAPSLTPPDTASSQGGIGTAVWNTDKRVNGLYSTFNARNSWMSITGTGWVKLGTTTDSACEAMTILAAHARTKLSRLDYAIDAGVTTEMYAW